MATYLPSPDHGLSAQAQKLSAERLETEVLLAELALGLSGTAFTDDAGTAARGAVARQVNLQVRIAESPNPDVIAEGRGRQSITYNSVNGQRLAVDPVALATARALLGPSAKSSATEADFRW